MRAGGLACAYCGGRSSTVDHMPPIAAFDGRQRPNQLTFPCCRECNEATREIDLIISWLVRTYPNSPPEYAHEGAELLHQVRRRFPEVATSMMALPSPRYLKTTLGLIVPSDRQILQIDEYAGAAISQFALKAGLALHYQETGRPASPNSKIAVHFYTSANDILSQIPDVVRGMLSDAREIVQGKLRSGDQFAYFARVSAEQDIRLGPSRTSIRRSPRLSCNAPGRPARTRLRAPCRASGRSPPS